MQSGRQWRIIPPVDMSHKKAINPRQVDMKKQPLIQQWPNKINQQQLWSLNQPFDFEAPWPLVATLGFGAELRL